MRFLDLALKDLSQLLREKRAFIFLVVMPVAFTLFMGMAFKGGSQDSDPRLALGWLSQNPTGLACKTLHDLISQSDVVRLQNLGADTTPADIAGQMHSGALAGVLLVPPDFNQQIQKGKIVQITLYTDEYSTNGQSVIQAVRGSLTRLMSSVKIADLTVKSLDLPDDSEHTSAFQDAAVAWQELTEPVRGTIHVVMAAEDLARLKGVFDTDLIVDALVGTGFKPPLKGLTLAGLKLAKYSPRRFRALRGRNVKPRKSNFSFVWLPLRLLSLQ